MESQRTSLVKIAQMMMKKRLAMMVTKAQETSLMIIGTRFPGK
jgi:CO dehydrogenase/acetyl-CoA synthase epsilon subunit